MTPQNHANKSGNGVNNAHHGNKFSKGNNVSNGNYGSNSNHRNNGNNGFGQGRSAEEPAKRITDKMASHLCILYLLLMLGCLAWQLFDTWIGRYSLLRQFGYQLQRQPTLRLIAFTLIAGALGGVVNGLRSTLHYCNGEFDRRHTWKYLCAPWMGATLALFVYALLRSSISVLGGNVAGNIGNTQVLSNFSAGALVGYGSKDVFVWLDAKVEKFFRVTPADDTRKRKESPTSSSKNSRRSTTVNQSTRRGPQTTQSGTLLDQRELSAITVASTAKAN